MENQTYRSEDTSSAHLPTAGFNIAGAFPVTDAIVRKVERARWQRKSQRILEHSRTVLWVAAGYLLLRAVRRSF